jgi:hypothetical protein
VSLPRCPRCKSAVNPARFPRCIGCGADVRNLPEPAARARRTVLHEAATDSSRTSKIFLIIGALGLFGAFSGLLNGYLIIACSFLGLLGAIAPMARVSAGPSRAGPSCSGALATLALCGLALIFGLGILVGFVCLELK